MKARMEPSIAEQAAQWILELEDGSQTASLVDFAAWLKASPRHVEEFLLASAAWKHFDGIDAARRIEIEQVLAEANSNVISLGAPEGTSSASAQKTTLRSASNRRWFVGLGLSAAVAGFALWWTLWLGTQTYATSAGEQRSVKLTDGSVLQLNTQSRVQVNFKQSSRDIRLLEGEALFTVAHQAERPFRVHAGDTIVQALGTEFNVRRRNGGTTVSVVEGLVKVSMRVEPNALLSRSSAPVPAAEKLSAGEQADIAADGAIAKHAKPNIADAIAWRERRLVFRDNTLADIIAEFNRYNAAYQIQLKDDAGEAIRLTGVFRADDPEAVLLYLDTNDELNVERHADGATIRRSE